MRNVRRNSEHDRIVRQLAETQHPGIGRPIFPTIRDLLCFAAVLGFHFARRTPLGTQVTELDSRTIINHQPTFDTVCLVALAGAKKAEILREDNENDMIAIFEEFANGGFEIISQWLGEKPDDLQGDAALLVGLRKNGFLDVGETSIDNASGDVSF